MAVGTISTRSWDSAKLQVSRVYIDSSIASVGITNCAYWFNAFSNCTEVIGFENLSGITNATQMFTSCTSLETIWATSFTNAITSVTGWANLSNVASMRYAMNGCTGVTSLDLRGMDPSSLTDLFYAFAGCSALTTTYADSTWALPAGVSGSGTFYNCRSLVGGNGTAWSSSNTGYQYMRIDRAGQAGYLTAA